MPGLLEEQVPSTSTTTKQEDTQPSQSASKPLPPGVVLGKDGKPCKTCTSSSAWLAMMKSSTKGSPNSQSNNKPSTASTIPDDPSTTSPANCPPSSEVLGRSTWTFLHTLAAVYPERAPESHQRKTASFLGLFAQLYPCWVCAEDFEEWMKEPRNDPIKTGALRGQEEFGQWMCRAHNAVNVKLGKQSFNCDLWRDRWVEASDGRCD